MTEPAGISSLKDEYELWRKNCRYMYDFVSETALTWPSLTVQWLPQTFEGGSYNARLLLGTHTSSNDDDYLKLASTILPSNLGGRSGKSSKTSSTIKISKKIKSSSEINRARYMPQDPNFVGAINGTGECELYDLKSGLKVHQFSPHTENGYGLSWNNFREGILLTASDDKTTAISDINKIEVNQGLIQRFESHTHIVNDAKWHNFDANIFGSVSDDRNVLIFDMRAPTSPAQKIFSPLSEGINSLAFSPFSKNLIAVGNQNANIDFFDMRVIPSSTAKCNTLHTMMGHGDGITCMEFSPHTDGILASGSQDRRVILWDMSKIGEEQTQEDAEDGAAEIFMMHAGHTGAVSDLSWCPVQDWTLASTADDNILHLWKVSSSLVKGDNTDTRIPVLE